METKNLSLLFKLVFAYMAENGHAELEGTFTHKGESYQVTIKQT